MDHTGRTIDLYSVISIIMSIIGLETTVVIKVREAIIVVGKSTTVVCARREFFTC